MRCAWCCLLCLCLWCKLICVGLIRCVSFVLLRFVVCGVVLLCCVGLLCWRVSCCCCCGVCYDGSIRFVLLSCFVVLRLLDCVCVVCFVVVCVVCCVFVLFSVGVLCCGVFVVV